MMHPILYEALSRHPKLKILRIIHPLSLHPPPPPSLAPPIVFRNLKSIHLTGLGSRTTYNWSMSSMPALQVFKVSWRISTRLSVIFPEHGPTQSRILKELHISNVVLDIPLRRCLDLLELQKLSLLDCNVGEESSWDEILRAEEQKVANAGSPASVLSTGSGRVVRQSPIPAVKHLKLKSLRINEVGKHWVNFLSSFAGLEELYILPSTSVIEQDTVEPFLDAIINFHGPTIRNLRLSTSQPVEKRCASNLVRSCKGLVVVSLRIPKSEWVRKLQPPPPPHTHNIEGQTDRATLGPPVFATPPLETKTEIHRDTNPISNTHSRLPSLDDRAIIPHGGVR